jgi:hypothetical protein
MISKMVGISPVLAIDTVGLQATWIILLALGALIVVGWRRPIRAGGRNAGRDNSREAPGRSRSVEVEHQPTELYRRPNPFRRLFAALMAGSLAVIVGAVLAVIASFAAIWAVVTVTGLLDR